MKDTQINFRFAKNWRTFHAWYNSTKQKGVCTEGAPWDAQKEMISKTFELTVPNIVDWKELWVDFESWWKEVCERNGDLSWDASRRQIETLMLKQLKSLDEMTFVLAYMEKGRPTIDPEVYTYWEAVRIKKDLEGDSNGMGGNENFDKITIVNLNKILS